MECKYPSFPSLVCKYCTVIFVYFVLILVTDKSQYFIYIITVLDSTRNDNLERS